MASSFYCSCYKGYKLDLNRKSCSGKLHHFYLIINQPFLHLLLQTSMSVLMAMEDVATFVTILMVHPTAVVKKVLNWMLIEKAVMVS